jgi:cell division protein FtsX
VLRVDFLPKTDALARFRADFPELADVATTLGTNPFPASFEVRLRPGAGVADDASRVN